MDQPRPTSLTSTLDAERTDQLRTFLTVEAAADAVAPARSAHPGRRRLVGGIAAAVVLGAGLFSAASIAGGPASGPARVETAHAVAIEQGAPGWTKISIADIDADPDAVVAELTAAGIDARREALPITRDAEGRLTLESFDKAGPPQDGTGGITMVGIGSGGEQGLAGLSVSSPSAGPSPKGTGATPAEAEAEFHAYLETLGAKTGTDGSIEIRNDADVTVLVLTET
jgi:hypothetical protein